VLGLIEEEQRNGTKTKAPDISLLCEAEEKTNAFPQKLLVATKQEMLACKGNNLNVWRK
jgi:hypothetical protein